MLKAGLLVKQLDQLWMLWITQKNKTYQGYYFSLTLKKLLTVLTGNSW